MGQAEPSSASAKPPAGGGLPAPLPGQQRAEQAAKAAPAAAAPAGEAAQQALQSAGAHKVEVARQLKAVQALLAAAVEELVALKAQQPSASLLAEKDKLAGEAAGSKAAVTEMQQQVEQREEEAAASQAAQEAAEQARQAAQQEKGQLEQRHNSLQRQRTEEAAIWQETLQASKARPQQVEQQAEQLAQQLKQQAQEAAAKEELLQQQAAASKAGQQAAEAELRRQLAVETDARKTAEQAAEHAQQAAQQEREQLHTAMQQQVRGIKQQCAAEAAARKRVQQAAEAAQLQVERLQPALAAREQQCHTLVAKNAQLERSLAEHQRAVQAWQQLASKGAATRSLLPGAAQNTVQQRDELQQLRAQLALTQRLAAEGAAMRHQQRQGAATLVGQVRSGLQMPTAQHALRPKRHIHNLFWGCR